jgi:hypothetical protein
MRKGHILMLVVASIAALAAATGASASLTVATSRANVTAATPPKLPAKFVACLKEHGVTLGAGGFGRPGGFKPGTQGTKRPALTPAQIKARATRRAAFAVCSKYAPKGFSFGRRGGSRGFAAYTACLKKQDVTLGKVSLTSAKFKAAAKLCKSLLPTTGTPTTGSAG